MPQTTNNRPDLPEATSLNATSHCAEEQSMSNYFQV